MRKAVIGAILLGVDALTFGSPIRDIRVLHSILSLTGLAGYLLLFWDPPVPTLLQRKLLIAGVIVSLVAFVIAFSGLPYPLIVLARLLAVGTIALPLWLVAGPARYAFVVAAAFALSGLVPAINEAGSYATSIHAYFAAIGAWWVALIMHNPAAMSFQSKPKRRVVVSNIVTLSEDQKKAALERIEKRYQNGEIPEHKYWDMRQEIESK